MDETMMLAMGQLKIHWCPRNMLWAIRTLAGIDLEKRRVVEEFEGQGERHRCVNRIKQKALITKNAACQGA